jgi:hypothetical protein
MLKQDIRIVYETESNKSYFCFDDMMAILNYKLDDNGSVNRDLVKRYDARLKLKSFIELYPSASFIPVDAIKNLPYVVGVLSNNQNHHSLLNAAVAGLLRNFMTAIKNRKEVAIEDDLEDFIEVNKHYFSVATNSGEIVVKATDILRYCGYKNLKVRDNFQEFSVKLKTKNGISNFIPLSKFPLIASEMNNQTYAKKLVTLFNSFNRNTPRKAAVVNIDKDKSVIIIGSDVIPYVIVDDNVVLQSSIVQKVCGYKSDGVIDSFRQFSQKVDDIHYISIPQMAGLVNSIVTAEYKENLKTLVNKLHKFA